MHPSLRSFGKAIPISLCSAAMTAAEPSPIQERADRFLALIAPN
jgi:hypothetical protein